MNSSSDDTYVENGATRQSACEAHGPFVSTFYRYLGRSHWTTCAACTEEKNLAERAQEVREQRERQAAEALAYSGLPLRHRGKGFSGFEARTKDQKHAALVSVRYADSIVDQTARPGSSLVFIGRPGTGKTHLATAIGETLAANCHHVRYTTVASLMQRLRASYVKNAEETEDEIINEVHSTWLLILDEVGSDRASEHDLRVLQDVIDFRYRELRRTIVISNLPMNELATAVGERIVDRLREMATVVAFNWRSHRAN